jgi:hypothetical protein
MVHLKPKEYSHLFGQLANFEQFLITAEDAQDHAKKVNDYRNEQGRGGKFIKGLRRFIRTMQYSLMLVFPSRAKQINRIINKHLETMLSEEKLEQAVEKSLNRRVKRIRRKKKTRTTKA